MKTILYPANERGAANHGWLNAKHTFSFAGYHDESKIHFGLLRVLNDDIVAPAQGFGMHPHDNMEIITIPLHGSLEHKDNTGGHGVIHPNEVQHMSAGTGVYHSEFNASQTEEVNLFQIWIFPKERNIKPRYDQKVFSEDGRKNQLQILVSPTHENVIRINQDAFLSRIDLSAGKSFNYTTFKKGNGVFAMVIEGDAEVGGTKLSRRDAVGISESETISIIASTDSAILFIEVPMN